MQEQSNISKRGILIAAVAVMYLSFFLPLFVSKGNSDFHYSLWDFMHDTIKYGERGYDTGSKYLFIPLALLIMPIFHLINGVKFKWELIIVSAIQLVLFWYLLKELSFEVYNISIGTYGYGLACVIVFLIGFNASTDNPNIVKRTGISWMLEPLDEKEKQYRKGTLRNEAPLASKAMQTSILIGLALFLFASMLGISIYTHFLLVICLIALVVTALLSHPVWSSNSVLSNEKSPLLIYIFIIALIGSLLGILPGLLLMVVFFAWVFKKLGIIK